MHIRGKNSFLALFFLFTLPMIAMEAEHSFQLPDKWTDKFDWWKLPVELKTLVINHAWLNQRIIYSNTSGDIKMHDFANNQSTYIRHNYAPRNIIDLSPTGKSIVADSNGRALRILSIGLKKQILKVQTPGKTFTSLKWASDRKIAAGTTDNSICIWNPLDTSPVKIICAHEESVNAVAWSIDGRIASASDDKAIKIWDSDTGQELLVLLGHEEAVNAVCWAADGRIASGADDKTIRIWNSKTGEQLAVLNGHQGGVTTLAWSSDGRIASGSDDYTVRIWNPDTAEQLFVMLGHNDSISTIDWSEDGKIASGSIEAMIRIWNSDTGEHIASCSSNSWVKSVRWYTPQISNEQLCVSLEKKLDPLKLYCIYSQFRNARGYESFILEPEEMVYFEFYKKHFDSTIPSSVTVHWDQAERDKAKMQLAVKRAAAHLKDELQELRALVSHNQEDVQQNIKDLQQMLSRTLKRQKKE